MATVRGTAVLYGTPRITNPRVLNSTYGENERLRAAVVEWQIRHSRSGLFGKYGYVTYFPLWYPALVSALAGIGVLRLGRRFTLRSALIATTVAAGLLGIAVAL
ncbi:hypothetical protein [Lacipirellula sp.]|uniref:hypothetical protein n=1 Tax=Lacipirellula sp. TaxID=2691419 RepID=UPI003D0BDAD5